MKASEGGKEFKFCLDEDRKGIGACIQAGIVKLGLGHE